MLPVPTLLSALVLIPILRSTPEIWLRLNSSLLGHSLIQGEDDF